MTTETIRSIPSDLGVADMMDHYHDWQQALDENRKLRAVLADIAHHGLPAKPRPVNKTAHRWRIIAMHCVAIAREAIGESE